MVGRSYFYFACGNVIYPSFAFGRKNVENWFFFAGTYRQLSKMTNCHCVHFFDRKMSANMFDKLKSSFMLASRAFSFYETLKCTCHFTFC